MEDDLRYSLFTIFDSSMPGKPRHRRYGNPVLARLDRLATDKPVVLSFLVFVVAAMIVVPVSIPFWIHHGEDLMINIVAEMYGMMSDLLIIGWFITWMNRRAEHRIMIRGYLEEIENVLRWESAEAMHRISSNVRRLNREGIHDITLEHAYLRGAYLVEICLAGAVLREATLSSAKLDRADLEGADLFRADLGLASLENATVCGGKMTEANCMGAYMLRTNLEGAYLQGANLQGAYVVEANLRHAYLGGVNFQGAFLESSDLRGAYVEVADLERARSLYGTLLDGPVEQNLRRSVPHLFDRSRLPINTAKPGEEALQKTEGFTHPAIMG